MTYKCCDVKSNGAITAKNGKTRNAFNEKPNFNKSKRVETKSKLEKPLKNKCTKRNSTNGDSNKMVRNSNKHQERIACNENISASDDSFSNEEDDKVNTFSNKDFRFKEPMTEVSDIRSNCDGTTTDRSTTLKIHLDDMFANGMQKGSTMSVSDDDSLASASCVSVSPVTSRRSSTLSSSTHTSSGTMELGCQTKSNYWNQPRQVHQVGVAFDNMPGLVGGSNITLLQLENSYEQKLQTLTKELTSICQKQVSNVTTTLSSISETETTWPLVTDCCGDALIDR